MAAFKRSVVINRPIEKVFDFATNLDNLAKMLPSVTKAELLTDGGMRPGAQIRETRQMNGKERSAVVVIEEHQRPTLHSASAGMLGMKATYRFRFAPDGAGTRADMEADVQGNLLWKPFLGWLCRTMEREEWRVPEPVEAGRGSGRVAVTTSDASLVVSSARRQTRH